MKKPSLISWALAANLIVVAVLSVNAQVLKRIDRISPIVCYEKNKTEAYRVPPPEVFEQWRKTRNARVKTASIEVEYIDFPADNLAKNAFQFALDIWETQLLSSVPIKVRAQWGSLEPGVLGQATWGSAFANFQGAQCLNIYYPVALAEKIAGVELNGPNDPEIVATFRSNANWYYGTDGLPPAGKMDLVTIVLHEIAHGLGFVDSYNFENSEGSVGLSSGASSVPFVYDVNVVNGSGQSLVSNFAAPSATLGTQLISQNLFYNSQLAQQVLGSRPKLYAPSTFSAGSSIAHLDETTFSSPGDANNLMTPSIAAQEVIHSPGNITLAILNDLGWLSTRIVHTELKDTERKDGQPYMVKATIISDNGFKSPSVTLNFRSSSSAPYTPVQMIATGVPNEFQANLPGSAVNTAYAYFITVEDNANRLFRYPGVIYQQNQAPVQNFVIVNIGPDTSAPVITHAPVDYVFDNDTQLKIDATVTDNLGVQSVDLQFSIKGGGFQVMPMTKTFDDNYSATIALPPSLVIGDLIKYRIIARDASTAVNTIQAPEGSGTYTTFVTGDVAAVHTYENDFNDDSFDFIGNSFSITTPQGFTNGAIHSEHPYKDGSDANSESNYVYQLQVPVILNQSNPYIQFDEIVLVEPGEDNSEFGDSDFYDYVVVEGSKDNGTTWLDFADGYDSRDFADWLTRYNSAGSNGNSTATGIPSLFRQRTINMLENSNFKTGDEVKIRFRLFADQAAHGWGWAIDNLFIQASVTGVEANLETEVKVFPNPAADVITIVKPEQLQDGALAITDMFGKVIRQQAWSESTTSIDATSLADGMYLINLRSGNRVVTKKILKRSR